MFEEAGIEHFVKLNKSISFRVVVPKSCLKKFTGFGYLNRACLCYLKAGEGADSWLSITVISNDLRLF